MKHPLPRATKVKKVSKKVDRSEQLIGATVVGERGQIVIPKDMRDRFKLTSGTKVMVMQHGDSPIMVFPLDHMQKMIQQMSERVAKALKTNK